MHWRVMHTGSSEEEEKSVVTTLFLEAASVAASGLCGKANDLSADTLRCTKAANPAAVFFRPLGAISRKPRFNS